MNRIRLFSLNAPESAESRPMPANERGWLHDNQGGARVEQASEFWKDAAVCSSCGFGLLLALLEERQLLAQEQILGARAARVRK